MQLSSQGITIALPTGWEGRIIKRSEPRIAAGDPVGPGSAAALRGVDLRERTYPITHLGNFALPAERGDFGSGAVDLMGPANLFISLVEFGPESVGQPLFSRNGIPTRLRLSQFNPNGLQRAIPGQAGHQTFFTAAGRAFCVYVVLGSHANGNALVPMANEVLAATAIEAP